MENNEVDLDILEALQEVFGTENVTAGSNEIERREVQDHISNSVVEVDYRTDIDLNETDIEILQQTCDTISSAEIERNAYAVTVLNEETIQEDEIDMTKSLVGVKGKTLEEMYRLYCTHASMVGFSVRKNTSRKRKIDGEYKEAERYYCCSFEGFEKSKKKGKAQTEDSLQKDDNDEKNKRKKKFTRTGCGAKIRIKLNNDHMFEVIAHVVAHNHELTKPQWQHYHRSERSISEEKAEAIEIMTKLSMKPSVQFNYMVEECEGEEMVGHTKKDHYNFVQKLRVKQIEGGDAQSLVDLLHQSVSDDSDFFFRVKLDDEGRLCNVFWRDSMMKEDFKIYGDVVVFDTTYRTNKYNLICGAFVGINNHWKNIMFGSAFITDERTESFEWLFEVFKKSMGGATPTSIFTDQDQAMSNAISKIFPETRHRLCQWHIHQNAITHYGHLKSDQQFNQTFKKCMRECYSVAEFEICWAEMIKKQNLEGNSWFERLYRLKDKWCTALSKDFFSAGILSSQRSESTNSSIGFKATKNTNLTEFFGIFKTIVKNWRAVEQKDEFDCSCKMPKSTLPMFGLLKHATQIYTLTVFAYFEEECIQAIASTIKQAQHAEDGTFVYHVFPEEKPKLLHQVTFKCTTKEVFCSCKHFEEVGWLCFHSVRVLYTHSISQIPEQYINQRWTKFAKADIWKREQETERIQRNLKKDSIPWRYTMIRRYYNLVLKSHKYDEARKVLESGYARDEAQLEELFERMKINDGGEAEANNASTSTPTTTVLDPPRSQTKGRVARKKEALERGRKKKNKQNIQPGGEFGTKTPNPRLF